MDRFYFPLHRKSFDSRFFVESHIACLLCCVFVAIRHFAYFIGWCTVLIYSYLYAVYGCMCGDIWFSQSVRFTSWLRSCSLKTRSWELEAEDWKLDTKGFWAYCFGEKQVKASIAWDHPCYLFTFNHLIHIACVYLVANKDILDIWYLVPWCLWDMHWVVLLVLNYNHDLVTWLMVYAINIKTWLFISNMETGG